MIKCSVHCAGELEAVKTAPAKSAELDQLRGKQVQLEASLQKKEGKCVVDGAWKLVSIEMLGLVCCMAGDVQARDVKISELKSQLKDVESELELVYVCVCPAMHMCVGLCVA